MVCERFVGECVCVCLVYVEYVLHYVPFRLARVCLCESVCMLVLIVGTCELFATVAFHHFEFVLNSQNQIEMFLNSVVCVYLWEEHSCYRWHRLSRQNVGAHSLKQRNTQITEWMGPGFSHDILLRREHI